MKSIRGHVIAGGRYHDIDFARLSLLSALTRRPEVRATVAASYDDLAPLDAAAFLLTYTCDILPDPDGTATLRRFLERGGRWLALHGTNSILAQDDKGKWFAPQDETGFMSLIGSQFAAHPPIGPFEVRVAKRSDPLVTGLSDFTVTGGDELYYMRVFGDIDVLLDAQAQGPAKGFVEREWPAGARHPVLYRKRVGAGEIVWFALGHRRGHYDMAPLIDHYPTPEPGAWEDATYTEILRRCVAWAIDGRA